MASGSVPSRVEDACDPILISIASPLMFLFFQAEDGIRDLTVTGVQTCALPILRLSQELIAVNDQICQLRPARTIEDKNELEQLKKKLRRSFVEKRKKK